jgi:hypothetical protein
MEEVFTIAQIMFGQAHGHQFTLAHGNVVVGRVTVKDGVYSADFISLKYGPMSTISGDQNVKIKAVRVVPGEAR